MSSSSQSMYSPRINGEMIPKYEGKKVILVCEVTESQGAILIVTASDKMSAQVILPAGTMVNPKQYLEVHGTVNGGRIVASSAFPLDNAMDMDTYNQAIKLAAAFPAIFSND